jgi:hypothetical protein
MSDLFRRISNKLRALSGQRMVRDPMERRRAPRFICSAPVHWQVGREQGEGQLREVSSTGLRIRTNKAFIAGKHIRVRPSGEAGAPPLSTDVAIGTIVYSRPRSGGFEVGIELINPDRISRFAWLGQLTREERVPPQGVPQVRPSQEGSPLRLVRGGQEDKDTGDDALIRDEHRIEKREKNSKK